MTKPTDPRSGRVPASSVSVAPGALVPDAGRTGPGKVSAPRVAIKCTPAGPTAEIILTPGAVGALGGSADDDFNATILVETLLCVRPPTERDGKAARLAAVAAALAAFKPKDEIEGMLAAQATALHFTAMECLRRAMLPNQESDIASKLRRDGVNLARGISDSVGTLTRMSGEAGGAASQVLGAAAELARQSDTLRGEVGCFIAGIRAA